MDFPSLEIEERAHEFHFGPEDVRTFAHEISQEDPRSLKEKLTFKKLSPRKPQWSATREAFEFTCGSGVIGVGSLWTRPVHVSPALSLRGAFFNLLERREVASDALGEQNLILHLRKDPTVGDGDDLARRVIPLHAEHDKSDAGWHGHFADVTSLLSRSREEGVYFSAEIAVTCARVPRLSSGCAFGYRALALSINAGNAQHAPANAVGVQ